MLITDADQLKHYCKLAINNSIIAFDTEFMRDKTYYPKLSLLQIATHDCVFAVDMMLGLDYTPLKEIFQSNILKVIHSARQDLEVLFNFFGFIPQNLFDTQIAGLFLGYQDAPSFELLVKTFMAEKVNKELQYSNWLNRPLSDDQIEYAIMDAQLLYKLFFKIKSSLEPFNRFDWVLEESNVMQSGEKFCMDPKSILIKFTNIFNKEMDIIKCYRLIIWREEKAKKFDIPRSHMLKDEVIIALCRQRPNTLEQLNTMRLNPLITEEMQKEMLEEIIRKADAQEHKIVHDIILSKKSLSVSRNNFFSMLKILVEIVAQKIGVQEQFIATTNDILLYANNLPSRINHGWRYETIGSLANAMKRGEIMLGYKEGRFFIHTNAEYCI